jgi:hypothetical protein
MEEVIMRRILAYAAAVATLGCSASVMAQTDPNPALNTPDKLAWTLFIQVNTDAKTAGNNNALFETWASDGETFTPNPVWPATPSPMSLRPRALSLESRAALFPPGRVLPQAVPGGTDGQPEETRRNRTTFDFIVNNKLFVISGLRAAFAAGTPLSLPEDSIEVKANWVELGHLRGFNGFSGSAADAARLYHVNKASDGKEYALVAMHVISKLVPNWTWATFEHKDNPGRCDVLGCRDAFGAQQAVVAPLSAIESQQHYGDCLKTPALMALINKAKWDPAYVNYCLKGSQTDFTDATGLAVRVGNSVTENGFVAQASCMTCHGRANFDATGKPNSGAGFDNTTGNASFGPINPAWYWTLVAPDGNLAAPSVPLYQNIPVLQRVALPADFIWSIPFCAIDDTATPPQTKSRCAGK